ncbi:FG-GAP repeat protein [Nostoc sp. PCC 7524]|uniref:beta strand repeat-containing protein n=1 Tax=Nostoc sp. (strain ATCC 29411 / PCC 7524) TaxID=28072 RepID=UPI00029F0BD1|nr:FG-GAP repeat protein [Nostoc sp. PCC 7524]
MTLLSFNLSELDGTNGFIINGIRAQDLLGVVSDAGDINGDGIDDVIVGAQGADVNGDSSGQSYVIFGQQGGFSPSLNLADLNGSNGFALNGINLFDLSGTPVSGAGDVNGDGIDDLIIGASRAGVNGLPSGQAYVVFGQQGGFSPSLNLADLNGSNGFTLNNNVAGYELNSVSDAGDINGDGIDDVIVGTSPFSTNPGRAYVVYGQQEGFSPSLNLADLNGSNGFVLNSINLNESVALSVSAAGDINGDGIDDLVIGAQRFGSSRTGQIYVVFGNQAGFSSSFDLSRLNGSNGFILNGTDGDRLSLVSDAGDINGDGIDDLIVGAFGAVSNGVASGQTYVVFGRREQFSPSFNLSNLNGSNGFAINGIGSSDLSGIAISGAGDVNGDGIDDLIIGAPFADPNGAFSGQSYVVYGREGGFAPSLNLADLNGGNGFALNGINSEDVSGASVSGAGDINGDGIDDLIIGAPYADPNGDFSGQSYVVYGRRGGFIPLVDTLVDENDGDLTPGDVSLREAISIAGNGATIAFSSTLNGGAIALTLGELEITNNITINGLGENNLTISGSNESQIFRIAGNAEVNIDGLTITNGFSDTNGGAIDNRGVLNLSNTTVRNSFTTADGGGINNLGTLNLLNTTLSNNTAGINGGAITNRGTITATNSIVSTNIALNNGGGIFNLNGTLQLVSNTITNNIVNSGNGGGIYSLIGQTTVNNTIIASNFDQGGESPDVNGLFTSNGYNLIGINDGSIGFVNGVNGNIVGTRTNPINPLLGSLENNHVPSIIGPAFDSGDPSLTGSDRLGTSRPQANGIDIGAVEFKLLDTVTVDNLTDEFDGDLSSGDVSLREALFIAAAGGNINFAQSLTGGTISLTLGTLNLNRNITIQGLGANNLTVDGNNTFSIFSINNNANTNISGLTLVNADNTAIVNNGTLILSDSIVRNSRGRFAGGIENQGNLTVINSKINNNIEEEGEGGGGIFNQGNTTLIDTTISNNSSGGILNNSSFILINSTVSNNNGRGIRNSGTLNLYNATISGNQSTNSGGGIINTGTLRVTNSTITNNSASQGGGIVNSGTAILGNTIVAGNNIIDGNVNLVNHFDVEGNFISNGNNLIGSNEGSTGFINTNNGDIVGTNTNPINPRLGTLQDNGGATFTHALLDDSIAINSGNNANLPEDIADLDGDNNISEPLPVDQRGVTRAQNGYVDIGAFESNIETRSIVSFQVIDSQANEKGGNFGRYTLTRTASREGLTALTVNFSLDGGNTATFSDDYNLLVNGTVINSINDNLSITFAQGQSQLNIDLIPVDDILLEDAETITINLNQAIEYAVDPNNNSGTVTIDPSDPLSIVTIQATDSQANERGGDLGRYTLTRTPSDGELRELTINLSLDAGNTATLTNDYNLEVNGEVITPINNNFNITFAEGQSELNIDLIPVNEFVNEDAETITLNLNQSSEYAVDPNNNSGTVTIAPSDPLSIVAIRAIDSRSFERGGDIGRYSLTRTDSEGELRELTVNISLDPGNTATFGDDYILEVNRRFITPVNGNFSITFAQGQSQLNIDLFGVDDLITEDAETITLNINEALGYAVDPINNSATVTMAASEQPIPQNHPLSTVDVGFYSVPTFIDENNDGDLDLFIGALDGTIAVAHNQGRAAIPNFANPIIIRDVGNRSTPTFADIATEVTAASCP